MLKFITVLFVAMLPINGYSNDHMDLATVNILLESINKSKVYQGRITTECLTVAVEHTTAEYHDLTIREKHAKNCNGDVSTNPVLDRFRLYSATKILWLDIVNNRYLSFDEFVKSGKGKK